MNKIRTYRRTVIAAISLAVAAAMAATGCCNIPEEPKVLKETCVFSVKGNDTLRLDRYYSSGSTQVAEENTASPIMIFAFGGGFKGGDRAYKGYLEYFRFLATEGYTVVSIDYRTMLSRTDPSALSSPVGFVAALQSAIDTAVTDLYDATAYVIGKQREWNIDPERIAISGSSAGAITVLQAEYNLCNGSSIATRLPEGFRYAGVVSFAGAISSADSLHWDNPPCPIMLFHGNADNVVPFRNIHIPGLGGLWGSATIADGLDAAGAPYSFYTVDNAGHGIASLPMTRNLHDIAGFLSRLVNGKEKLSIRNFESTPGAATGEQEFSISDYLDSNR